MRDPKLISREKLYELVWSEPMLKLAGHFNLSDRGLAKKCKQHAIPCPPAGYWAKLQHGHKVERLPLPVNNTPELETVAFWPKIETASSHFSDSKYYLGEEQFAKALAFNIPNNVARYHPVIAACRRSYKESDSRNKIDKYGRIIFNRVRSRPSFKVTPDMFDRACLFLQGLITLFDEIDWPFVEVYRVRPDEYSPWGFKHGGETLQFELKEAVTKILPDELEQKNKTNPSKKRLFEPDFSFANYVRPLYKSTGKFEFSIKVYSVGFKIRWQDKGSELIEHQLGAIAQGFSRAFEHSRIQAIEHEKSRQEYRRKEAERAELLHLKKIEEKRREQLVSLSDTYDKLSKIKRLIAAVEQQGKNDPRLEAWLSWAHRVLRELDPLENFGDILQSYEAAGKKEREV